MIDPFDYKEPSCALCGGKEFYNPDKNAPAGRIPVKRIIEKLDGLFNANNMTEAGRLLEYWQNEAVALKDREGELEIDSELIGFYRKINDKEKGLKVSRRAMELLTELGLSDSVSGATVLLNAATTFKCFGLPEKALSLYGEVSAVYSKNLDKNDLRFAGFYNNKALTLVDLQKYAEAEKCYAAALKVLESSGDVLPDIAVTKVNMAHMYECSGERNKITDCLFSAYEFLNDENMHKNGYYAYVCDKCAPSFGYFGYSVIEKELKERAKSIYEGN